MYAVSASTPCPLRAETGKYSTDSPPRSKMASTAALHREQALEDLVAASPCRSC